MRLQGFKSAHTALVFNCEVSSNTIIVRKYQKIRLRTRFSHKIDPATFILKMYTLLGTFARQKKSRKEKFNRLEFTYDQFFMGRPGDRDMRPASEAKGFILVDKRNEETSIYLDTNQDGILNTESDLLIGLDVFERSLYKSKKGSLLATGSLKRMPDAIADLYEEDPDILDSLREELFVASNKKGRTLDLIPLLPLGPEREGLRPIWCTMDSAEVRDDEEWFQRWQGYCSDVGVELI